MSRTRKTSKSKTTRGKSRNFHQVYVTWHCEKWQSCWVKLSDLQTLEGKKCSITDIQFIGKRLLWSKRKLPCTTSAYPSNPTKARAMTSKEAMTAVEAVDATHEEAMTTVEAVDATHEEAMTTVQAVDATHESEEEATDSEEYMTIEYADATHESEEEATDSEEYMTIEYDDATHEREEEELLRKVSHDSPPHVERKKSKKCNKRALNKRSKNKGLDYLTYKGTPKPMKKPTTKKIHSSCISRNLQCNEFNGDDREALCRAFHEMGSIDLKREYILRHVNETEKKRSLANRGFSRRRFTKRYFLPLEGVKKEVCKVMFLTTLNISDKFVRTAVSKLDKETGILEKSKAGGIQKARKREALRKRGLVRTHLIKFPKMESHFVRKDSTKLFLSPDLNISRMYRMYIDSHATKDSVSRHIYADEFKKANLSFHKPKKDQCSICLHYRSTDPENEIFLEHLHEKTCVREERQRAKEFSKGDPRLCTAVLDLQQIIHTPMSQQDKVFYKSRLANFNFTIYEIDEAKGHCYLWNETEGRKGSTELGTALLDFLKKSR